jgi:hypothetical protein
MAPADVCVPCVCADISRPFLVDQKKFDMRFLVLVKSIEPLEIYLYNVHLPLSVE